MSSRFWAEELPVRVVDGVGRPHYSPDCNLRIGESLGSASSLDTPRRAGFRRPRCARRRTSVTGLGAGRLRLRMTFRFRMIRLATSTGSSARAGRSSSTTLPKLPEPHKTRNEASAPARRVPRGVRRIRQAQGSAGAATEDRRRRSLPPDARRHRRQHLQAACHLPEGLRSPLRGRARRRGQAAAPLRRGTAASSRSRTTYDDPDPVQRVHAREDPRSEARTRQWLPRRLRLPWRQAHGHLETHVPAR